MMQNKGTFCFHKMRAQPFLLYFCVHADFTDFMNFMRFMRFWGPADFMNFMGFMRFMRLAACGFHEFHAFHASGGGCFMKSWACGGQRIFQLRTAPSQFRGSLGSRISIASHAARYIKGCL